MIELAYICKDTACRVLTDLLNAIYHKFHLTRLPVERLL